VEALMRRVVYYAMTENDYLLRQLKESLGSLRRFNRTIPVFVFIFAKKSFSVPAWLKRYAVEVRHLAPLAANIYPYLVKWIPLSGIEADQVLFLDADTYFYDDVEKLFDHYSLKDIYGRRAIGTTYGSQKVGSRKITSQLLVHTWKEFHRRRQLTPRAILNAGVLIFNRRSHRKVTFEVIRAAYAELHNGDLPYPSQNTYNRGEIAAAVAFSSLGLSIGLLSPLRAPYFVEWHQCDVAPSGIVLHIFSENYRDFLREGWNKPSLPEKLIKSSPDRRSAFSETACYRLNDGVIIAGSISQSPPRLRLLNKNSGELYEVSGVAAKFVFLLGPRVAFRSHARLLGIRPGTKKHHELASFCAKLLHMSLLVHIGKKDELS
jgi:hypothetical protein